MASTIASLVPERRPLNVIIVGGSLSGLMNGLMLKRNGHNVQILEQTANELEHQAAGVVAGPPVRMLLDKFDHSERPFSLACKGIVAINSIDKVINFSQQNFGMLSWDVLYYRLRWNFDGLRSAYYPDPLLSPAVGAGKKEGSAIYRKGHRFVDLEVSNGLVTAHFENTQDKTQGKLTGDLLIGADGPTSTVRPKAGGPLPSSLRKYAGYVLWRGVVNESEVSEKTRLLFEQQLTFLVLGRQYVIAYHIPGRNGSLAPGSRLLNFAWYTHYPEVDLKSILTDRDGYRHRWSVPIGKLRDEVWAAQKQRGEGLLSPAFQELADTITQPFLQVISDSQSPEAMFHGARVLLVGDAQSTLRPHSGKGISQAASQCLLLEKCLKGEIDVNEWERQCQEISCVNSLESVSWGHYYMSGAVTWFVAALQYRLVWRLQQLKKWWYG